MDVLASIRGVGLEMKNGQRRHKRQRGKGQKRGGAGGGEENEGQVARSSAETATAGSRTTRRTMKGEGRLCREFHNVNINIDSGKCPNSQHKVRLQPRPTKTLSVEMRNIYSPQSSSPAMSFLECKGPNASGEVPEGKTWY
jgi:hypothetical protein